MKDVREHLERWQAEGKRFTLATVVRVERAAPRPPGTAMAICEDGRIAGSVTGGCIESAVYEEARSVLESGVPKLVTFGIPDEQGFAVGLSCGGTVHVFLDRPVVSETLLRALADGSPLALTVVIAGERIGARMAVLEDGCVGSLGDLVLDQTVAGEARLMLARRQTGVRSLADEEVFIQAIAPRPLMFVFGAVDFGAALCGVGKLLGYHVIVSDPRAAFATRERFPEADEVVVSWPDDVLARSKIDASTAICVLSHDPKLDIPALKQALSSDAGYIGAMGSRRTNETRMRRLAEEGCAPDQLARIHAPIGLDLGGREPDEVAVAIAAEIIAARHRATTASPAAASAG